MDKTIKETKYDKKSKITEIYFDEKTTSEVDIVRKIEKISYEILSECE